MNRINNPDKTEKQFRFLKYYAIILTVLDKMAEGPARDSLITELFAKVPPEQLSARRVFIGRDVNKSAIIDLSDRMGIPRLRLIVDSLGDVKINFMDTNGYVFYTIPE
jgi:hypothetical protein